MVIKKKIIPVKSEIKKELEDNKYTPVFEDIVVYQSVRYEFNWIGIRRSIQSINIFKLFDRLKLPEKEKEYLSDKSVIKFNYKFWFNNLWFKYCKWFDFWINKKVE